MPLLLAALVLPGALLAQDSVSAQPRDSAGRPIEAIPGIIGRDSAGRPVGAIPEVIGRDSAGRPIAAIPESLPPRRIERIEIIRADVFDSSEAHSFVPNLVNGLHIMTHEGIITREILFKVGDVYDSSDVAETARNLRRVGVFRKVAVDSITGDSGVIMRITAKDGWSTALDLRFRLTGKQADWQVALNERNLLGTATRFSTKYRKTPDRTSVLFSFLQPRLLARTVSLGLRYEDRSDGSRQQVAIERPFFTLSDKAGISTLLDVRNERVLQFFDGINSAGDSLRRRYFLGRVEGAKSLYANRRGYLHLGLTAQVRRDDYAAWPNPTATRRVTGSVGPFIEWRRANFAIARGFAKQGQDEDVDLSNFVRLGLSAAPQFLGYDQDGLGGLLQVRIGTQLPSRGGFAWIDARVNGVYSAARDSLKAGLDSGSVTLGGTIVVSPSRRHLAIAHADIGWLKAPLPGTEFDLGFATGPRGFPIHAFTGDRSYYLMSEYRVMVTDEFLKSVALGVAGFVDHGGAWYSGQPRRTGTNLGLGLRLSPSRVADANQTRLDLAYRLKNDRERAGWVFVIASGLTFSTQPRSY